MNEELRRALGEISDKAAQAAAVKHTLAEEMRRVDGRFSEVERKFDEIAGPRGVAGRLSELEADFDLLSRKGIEAGRGQPATIEQREHKTAFENWLRSPTDASRITGLIEAERKTATGLTGAAGGFAVPELLWRDIARRIKDASPMRSVAKVIAVSSTQLKHLVNRNDASSNWVGETDARSATAEPQLEERAPTFGTVYSYISATEELVLDAQMSVAEWFSQTAADEINQAEGYAFVSGNGSNKPTGFLHVAAEAGGDFDSPERAAGALQYFPTGAADGFGVLSTTSPVSNPADVLFDAVYGLRTGYRQRARWMMNSKTAGALRKLTDGDGRFLWSDSLAEDQPPRLLGYPVVLNEQMPDIGANALPIAFGDFARGYLIADQGGLRVTFDDNITTPGRMKWYLRRRVGGCVLDSHAIKLVKMATS